jgi:TPR repeat protein
VAHWTFIVIAVVWSVSPSKVWIFSFDKNVDCQSGINQETSVSSLKGCHQQGQSFTEKTQFRLGEFASAEASPGGRMDGSHNPIPTSYTTQLVTQQYGTQKSLSDFSGLAGRSSSRAISTSPEKVLPPSPVIRKEPFNSSPDERLAQRGDAFAQYRLGRFYAQLGGPKAPESVSWYVKAADGLQRLAEAGNGQAMYVLGVMYAYGRGVARDEEQARLWLLQAVDQQVPDAHMVLARLDGQRNTDPR